MITTRRKFFGKLGLLAAAAAGVKAAPVDDTYKCVITPNVKEFTLNYKVEWSPWPRHHVFVFYDSAGVPYKVRSFQ